MRRALGIRFWQIGIICILFTISYLTLSFVLSRSTQNKADQKAFDVFSAVCQQSGAFSDNLLIAATPEAIVELRKLFPKKDHLDKVVVKVATFQPIGKTNVIIMRGWQGETYRDVILYFTQGRCYKAIGKDV